MSGLFANETGKAKNIYLAAKSGNLADLEIAITSIVFGIKKKEILDMASEDDGNFFTPLYIASKNGHIPVVKALLRHGADVDKATTDNG
jgi:ankyrin repeat protein